MGAAISSFFARIFPSLIAAPVTRVEPRRADAQVPQAAVAERPVADEGVRADLLATSGQLGVFLAMSTPNIASVPQCYLAAYPAAAWSAEAPAAAAR